MQNRKITAETIIRTVVLAIALINQVLVALGVNPLPFSEDAIYEGLSAVITVVSAMWAWWKNNSFTKAAIEADDYMKIIKKSEKEAE